MKVLVVDDEQANRLILQAMLKRSGHEVIEAEDGKKAVELFDQEQPDIVLMDVMMPVMDGYEATRIIKEHSKNNFVPIIFLTAITDEDALVECISSGGDDFLTKPYNRTILQAKIEAMERIRKLNATVTMQNRELEEYYSYLQREQEVAEQIFSKLMQQGEPDLSMVHSHRESAATFNGDILLLTQQPSGVIYMLVGDFTGHGLAAALGALPAAQIFYAMVSKGFSIEEILVEINQRLKSLLPTGMFLAATLMQIDPHTSSATIWNGGFPDVLIIDSDNNIISRIPSGHLPLGVVDQKSINHGAERVELEEGYRIIAYSDGVIESMNEHNEMYGQERLEEKIIEDLSLGTGMVQNVIDSVNSFREGAPPQDDVSLIEFVCDEKFLNSKISSTVDLLEVKPKNWELSFVFKHDMLTVSDPVPILMSLLRDVQGLHEFKEELFLILTELYLNALEYGVLGLNSLQKQDPDGFEKYYQEREKKLVGLDEGWVKIDLIHKAENNYGELQIIIEDSGKGFDCKDISTDMPSLDVRGRGIALVKSLVKSMHYNDAGNRVEVVYECR
ncbi:MAG: fused response regulator/phosphatase [Gammaproteobacteria bacterium]|nr:fused response regulator/phosphatase [Gammaproteobacteria bacterium]